MEGDKNCIWNRWRTLIKTTQTHQRETAFRVKVTGNEIKQRDQTRDFPSGHSIELHETCMVGCLAKVLLNNPTTNSTSVFTFVLHHTHAVCRKGPNIYISLISGLPSFSHTKTTGEEVDNSSRRSSRDQNTTRGKIPLFKRPTHYFQFEFISIISERKILSRNGRQQTTTC